MAAKCTFDEASLTDDLKARITQLIQFARRNARETLEEYCAVEQALRRESPHLDLDTFLDAHTIKLVRTAKKRKFTETYLSALAKGDWKVDRNTIAQDFGPDTLRSERFLRHLRDLSRLTTYDTAKSKIHERASVRHSVKQGGCSGEKFQGSDLTKAFVPADVRYVLDLFAAQIDVGRRSQQRRTMKNGNAGPIDAAGLSDAARQDGIAGQHRATAQDADDSAERDSNAALNEPASQNGVAKRDIDEDNQHLGYLEQRLDHNRSIESHEALDDVAQEEQHDHHPNDPRSLLEADVQDCQPEHHHPAQLQRDPPAGDPRPSTAPALKATAKRKRDVDDSYTQSHGRQRRASVGAPDIVRQHDFAEPSPSESLALGLLGSAGQDEVEYDDTEESIERGRRNSTALSAHSPLDSPLSDSLSFPFSDLPHSPNPADHTPRLHSLSFRTGFEEEADDDEEQRLDVESGDEGGSLDDVAISDAQGDRLRRGTPFQKSVPPDTHTTQPAAVRDASKMQTPFSNTEDDECLGALGSSASVQEIGKPLLQHHLYPTVVPPCIIPEDTDPVGSVRSIARPLSSDPPYTNPQSTAAGALSTLRAGALLSSTAIELALKYLNPTPTNWHVLDPAFVDVHNQRVIRTLRLEASQPHILVPLHHSHIKHWTVATVDLADKNVTHYDSLHLPSLWPTVQRAFGRMAAKFTIDVAPTKSWTFIDHVSRARSLLTVHWTPCPVSSSTSSHPSPWHLHQRIRFYRILFQCRQTDVVVKKDGPSQTNNSDCGIFVLLYCACAIHNIPLPDCISPGLWRAFFAGVLAGGTGQKLEPMFDRMACEGGALPKGTYESIYGAHNR